MKGWSGAALLALAGLLAGGATGWALRPPPPPPEGVDSPLADAAATPAEADTPRTRPEDLRDYARLNNQFVVPVLTAGQVEAFVILALSLEVMPGSTQAVYSREARLRDAFLRVLFEHANAGGFQGNFTDSARMATLRAALREAAQGVLGRAVTDVLIVDMVRQDG